MRKLKCLEGIARQMKIDDIRLFQLIEYIYFMGQPKSYLRSFTLYKNMFKNVATAVFFFEKLCWLVLQ